MADSSGTYGIKGLPRPETAITRSRDNGIPYVEGLPVRREVSALADSTEPLLQRQWTLFVLALERFKLKPVDDKLSYFQVAGIHGYPEGSWDNAPPPRQDPTNPGKGDQPYGGYCNHNALNFPTWHRPYMALFEQCIWDNMSDVINYWVTECNLDQESELPVWNTAKDTWRMPYWDWARQQSYNEEIVSPQVLLQESVRIFPPESVKRQYHPSGLYTNPLWSFKNPEKDGDGNPHPFGDMPKDKKEYNVPDNPAKHDPTPPQDEKDSPWMPWSETKATSRYGIFIDPSAKGFIGLDGVNNVGVANNQLVDMKWSPITDNQKAQAEEKNEDFYLKWSPGTLSDAVNRMLSPNYNSTWGQFASTKWTHEGHGNSMSGFLSLEYIHNNVHNITGGSDFATGVGHMSDVPVAALDPIFWLHHTQIDRLLAIWQCLYPKLWWDQEEPGHNNVADDTQDDPLYPFHDKDNGDPVKDVWTARNCRDWTVLNYQYDDLMELSQKALDWEGNLDEPKFQTLLQAHLHEIYPSTEHVLQDIRARQHTQVPAALMPDLCDIDDDTWKDYIINVIYDRYALDGQSYTIKFYLGGPADEDVTHFEPQNIVGSVYTFGGGLRRTRDSCANCKVQADTGVLSCAQVPLTVHLLHHTIDSVADHPIDKFDDVEEYMRRHLRWKIYEFGGSEVDENNLERFSKTSITVLRGAAQPRNVANSPRIKFSELDKVSFTAADISVSHTPLNGAKQAAQGSQVALPPAYTAQPYEPLPEITNNKPFGLQYDGRYRYGFQPVRCLPRTDRVCGLSKL